VCLRNTLAVALRYIDMRLQLKVFLQHSAGPAIFYGRNGRREPGAVTIASLVQRIRPLSRLSLPFVSAVILGRNGEVNILIVCGSFERR